METKRIENIFLSLQDFKNDKVKGYEFKYTKQKIAGQFFLNHRQLTKDTLFYLHPDSIEIAGK